MSFKEVWDVLEKEFSGRAVNDLQHCQYLTAQGRKCAIGCFIPKGHKATSDIYAVGHLLEVHPDLVEYMPCKNIEVLRKFQFFHDDILTDTSTVEEQRAALFNEYVKLCKEYGVKCE